MIGHDERKYHFGKWKQLLNQLSKTIKIPPPKTTTRTTTVQQQTQTNKQKPKKQTNKKKKTHTVTKQTKNSKLDLKDDGEWFKLNTDQCYA